MFEINESPKIQVKVYGQEFQLSRPTRKQVVEMQRKLKEAQGQELDVMGQFFVELGLSQEIVDRLELGHMELLSEHVVGAKKK